MKLIPDTSVIIDGRITSMIQESGEYKGATIIVPEAVIAELEAQANQGREIGFSGLIELQELSKLAEDEIIELKYTGERPSLDQVKLASGGEIDALIRKVALESDDAKFITSDLVQSEVAKAKGLDVLYLKPQTEEFSPITIEKYFDEDTLCVCLKERAKPYARKGTPDNNSLVSLSESVLSEYELKRIAQEILERAKRSPEGFVEIEKRGITIVQIGAMRITICRRPFSDGMEITAVRPRRNCSLSDYRKCAAVKNLLAGGRKGILVVGMPGAGKTSVAQSIAVYLADKGCSVKTMESSRDLTVPDRITQYGELDGSMENTSEILLMMRPDCIVFDELRKSSDFKVYSELRLAGVSVIGVVHAGSAHDALFRFMSKTEFGVLSQVIDTIIAVKDGDIARIYDLKFEFRVPDSLPDDNDELPARPVISVINTETGQAESEIFRYDGESIVVNFTEEEEYREYQPAPARNTNAGTATGNGMGTGTQESSQQSLPVEIAEEDISMKLVERDIQREIGRFTNGSVDVRMQNENKAVVYIDDKDVPAAIGKGGKNVAAIVNKLSIGIDIRPRSELVRSAPAVSNNYDLSPSIEIETTAGGVTENGVEIKIDKKSLIITAREYKGKIVDIFGGKEYLFTATVNDMGEIHMSKSNSIAMDMIRRYNDGEEIRLRPV